MRVYRALKGKPSVKAFSKGWLEFRWMMKSLVFMIVDVFVHEDGMLFELQFCLWLQKNKMAAILNVFCWKHLNRIPAEQPKSFLGSFRSKRNFPFFISVHLGCDFTPLASLLLSHPWTINISTSQSIFIIKHMPNAVCGCEDTGLLFIHLIYLYFFPEGETLVSIHLCWLLAITEHLELLLNWPEGSIILQRSTCFGAERCACCVHFCEEATELSQEW